MTGGGSRKIARPADPDPDPAPTPIAGREEEEAKKKTLRRRFGRESTILAGRFNQQSGGNNILNTRLG